MVSHTHIYAYSYTHINDADKNGEILYPHKCISNITCELCVVLLKAPIVSVV